MGQLLENLPPPPLRENLLHIQRQDWAQEPKIQQEPNIFRKRNARLERNPIPLPNKDNKNNARNNEAWPQDHDTQIIKRPRKTKQNIVANETTPYAYDMQDTPQDATKSAIDNYETLIPPTNHIKIKHHRNKRKIAQTDWETFENNTPKTPHTSQSCKRYKKQITFTNPEVIKRYICLQNTPPPPPPRITYDIKEQAPITTQGAENKEQERLNAIANLLDKTRRPKEQTRKYIQATEKKERNRAIRYCENVEIIPANFPIPKRYKPKVPIQEPTIKLPDQKRRKLRKRIVREWELNNPDIANQPLIDWDQNESASYHSHIKHDNSVNALQTQSTINPSITQLRITPTVRPTQQPKQALQPKRKRREW